MKYLKVEFLCVKRNLFWALAEIFPQVLIVSCFWLSKFQHIGMCIIGTYFMLLLGSQTPSPFNTHLGFGFIVSCQPYVRWEKPKFQATVSFLLHTHIGLQKKNADSHRPADPCSMLQPICSPNC